MKAERRRSAAYACSKDTPLYVKLRLAAPSRWADEELREKMARCPFMDAEVLDLLYDDYKYLVSINPQTPAEMMDEYISGGTEQEQLGCFTQLAQSQQLKPYQWDNLAKSKHVAVRRELAKVAYLLPEGGRASLLGDAGDLVREFAAKAIRS